MADKARREGWLIFDKNAPLDEVRTIASKKYGVPRKRLYICGTPCGQYLEAQIIGEELRPGRTGLQD